MIRPSQSAMSQRSVQSAMGRPTIDNASMPTHSISRATLAEILDPEFYKKETWYDELMERLFKIQDRETTIKLEVYYGVIHFISCFYCLAVIPQQMNKAGYNTSSTFVATAACSGLGSIILGLFANLPFVMAPPTVVTIFFSLYLQNSNLSSPFNVGSAGVIISGALLTLMGYRPLGNFIGRLIPYSLQAGTAIGIGLLTALAGMTDVNFVTTGGGSELLRLAPLTFEIGVSIAGVIIICLAQYYHIKGSFCIAIIVCSFVYNFYDHGWPHAVYTRPVASYYDFTGFNNGTVPLLVADLLFLYILYLNGLISSLSYLAGLTRDDGMIPRGRWVFLLTGMMTVVSGIFTGAPVLISPESAAGIKEGAKTGLSAVICGFLFIFSIIFAPIFESIPDAGTSPILFMIGVLLFQNVLRVDWKNVSVATPAFVVLFFIPFSFSVIQGVLVGYVVYLVVGMMTGTFFVNLAIILHIYFPVWAAKAGLKLPMTFDALQKHNAGHGNDGDTNANGDGDDDDDGEEDDEDDDTQEDDGNNAFDPERGFSRPPKIGGSTHSIHDLAPGATAAAGGSRSAKRLSPRMSNESNASNHSTHSLTGALNRVIINVEHDLMARDNSIGKRDREFGPSAGAAVGEGSVRRRRATTVAKDERVADNEYMFMGFEGDHLFDIQLTATSAASAGGNTATVPPPPTSASSPRTGASGRKGQNNSTRSRGNTTASGISSGGGGGGGGGGRGDRAEKSIPAHVIHNANNVRSAHNSTHDMQNINSSFIGRDTAVEGDPANMVSRPDSFDSVAVDTNTIYNSNSNQGLGSAVASGEFTANPLLDATHSTNPGVASSVPSERSSNERTERGSVGVRSSRVSLSGGRTVEPGLTANLVQPDGRENGDNNL